jgi:DNA-directed RNA polymerase subunit RPC12/RpoP
MYICRDCGEHFEEPKEVVEMEGYGHCLYSYECPACGGDYEEAVTCLECGELFLEDDLTEGYCTKCEKVLQDKVKEFFKQFNDDQKNYILESGILDEV